MLFIRDIFYLSVLFYISAWIISVFNIKQNLILKALFYIGLSANGIALLLRYYFSFPLMPMYLGPSFLPFFIGIFSIKSVKSIWNQGNPKKQNTERLLPSMIILSICLLSATAIFFPNDFYLPFLRSKTIFAHIFLLSGVMGEACFVIAGINMSCEIINRHIASGLSNKKQITNNIRKKTERSSIGINSDAGQYWIIIGFALWTISMFSGELWSYLGWGSPIVWNNAGILTTLAIWLYYACFLHFNFLKTWNYKKKTYAAVFGTILTLALNFFPELGIFHFPEINHLFQFYRIIL